eukprot:4227252-Ditylum_brightwellii.AAC.1
MCDDIDGSGYACHETPEIPSPRTNYSVNNKKQYDLWWEAHTALNQSAAHHVRRRSNFQPLVLMGDSITEAYLGTVMGEPQKQATEGIPAVLSEMAQSESFHPLVLAIAGDQTQHLLYRLQHGELPSSISQDENAIFVIHIGTNNIGKGHLPEKTVDGIVAVTSYVLSNTAGQIILVEILPRGDGSKKYPRLCPPQCDSYGKPFTSFLPAVDKVNA